MTNDDFALALAALDLAIVYAEQAGIDPRKLAILRNMLNYLRETLRKPIA